MLDFDEDCILDVKNVSFRNNRKRKETTFYHCRLLLETETEPGTKSRFHYLCLEVHAHTKHIYNYKVRGMSKVIQ